MKEIAAEAMAADRLEQLLMHGDEAMVVQTFRRHPSSVLPFIDEFLEGGLAIIEQGRKNPVPNQDPQRVAMANYKRAMQYAKLANDAFGEVIFTEYAGAFGGWSPMEQQRFREGQAQYRQGRELAKSSPEEAIPILRRSLSLADSLGDYWGMAMAQLAIADACATLSRAQEGHDAAIKAIELFGRLHLKPSHVKALTTCATLRQQMQVPDMGTGQLRMALQVLPADAPVAQRREIVDQLIELLTRLGRTEEVERLREVERARAAGQ
jgi:hypothetical protein